MIDLLANNLFARLAFLAIVFGAVILVTLAVFRQADRAARIRAGVKEIGSSGSHGLTRTSLQEKKDTAWSRLADRIESTGLNLADTRGDALRQKLIAAGYTSPSAPRIFTLSRLILVLVLPAGYVLLTASSSAPMSFGKLYLYGSALAIAGLYLPNLFISAKADRRREEITNGFPDCLDLMLVCVEAGLGLESAMDRVGREMITSHPLGRRAAHKRQPAASRRCPARGSPAPGWAK